MTTYLSATSEGGRFGRIVWENGDADYWGGVSWDPWWPGHEPDIERMLAAVAEAGRKVSEGVQKLVDSVNAMVPAFAKLAETVAKAGGVR